MYNVDNNQFPSGFSKFLTDVDNKKVENGITNSKKQRLLVDNRVKELFIFTKDGSFLNKDVSGYKLDTLIKQNQISIIHGKNSVLDPEKHMIIEVRMSKDGKHSIFAKKEDVHFFEGKNIVLHRGKGKRRERLKNKNIVLVQMSDEQYANVSSYAMGVFSKMSKQAKKEAERKKLKKNSPHKLLDRSKIILQRSLNKKITECLRKSELIKHIKENQVSSTEIQEQGIEEERDIKRKQDIKEEEFEQVAINIELKEKILGIIKENANTKQIKNKQLSDKKVEKQ